MTGNKESKETKERVSAWITPQTLKQCDAMVILDNCRSRSAFIEKAILFYAGYVCSTKQTDFLNKIISESIQGIVSTSENRIAKLQFKQAVEIAKMSKLMAAAFQVDEDVLHQLHIDCVNEVKKTNGVIKMSPVQFGD